MRHKYMRKKYRPDNPNVYIEPLDVFGNEWEIVEYRQPPSDEGDFDNAEEADYESYDGNEDSSLNAASERIVLYHWDDGYSSYVPPESGWQPVGDQGE